MEFIVKPSNSARRNPHPMSIESIARLRLLRRVSALALSSNVSAFADRVCGDEGLNRLFSFQKRPEIGQTCSSVLPRFLFPSDRPMFSRLRSSWTGAYGACVYV